jgi:hypothetical protein
VCDRQGAPFRFDPLNFDGSAFARLEEHRANLLADIDDLHLRIANTRALGEILTPDTIRRNRAVVLYELDIRNDMPTYDPLFLTFLENRHWIKPTDHALRRMAAALSKTPNTYREFVSRVRTQPMGGLFELNVYDLLDHTFPGAVPQPKLPGTDKRSDVLCVIDGHQVYVEAAVIGEADYYRKQRESARALQQKVWTASGPDHEARRVTSKIAGELDQTNRGCPNILCLSFFDWDPLPIARTWAITDAWLGAPKYGQHRHDGSRLDFSSIGRVDSIFEFSRDRLINVHINPNSLAECRLDDATRKQFQTALAIGKLMIR